MPHDPITLRQDVLLKDRAGANDRVVLTKYEAPAAANEAGVVTLGRDPHAGRDQFTAKLMMAWLEREYPGHLWATHADHCQGVVMFSIPILMGTDKWFVVNLRTHDIIDGLKKGAGEILERYRLPRGRFELDPFLEARAKHSRLVVPSRKIPE